VRGKDRIHVARNFNALWLALAALLLVLLPGCSDWPDAHEARICRMLAPAINPPGASIDVLRSRKLQDGRVEIMYDALVSGPESYRRILTCEFSGSELSAVWSDGRPIGDVRLVFLKRFWLRTNEAAAADPAPYMYLGSVPEVSRSMAIALQHTLSALPLISLYALLAPAYALVYGLIGRINLAFGEFAAIGGYGALIGAALAGAGSPWLAVILICLALGLWAASMHGLAASQLVFLPLRRASGQHTLIATVGLAIALQEYLRLTQGTAMRWVGPMLNQPIGLARSEMFVVTATPISGVVTVIALVAAGVVLIAMRKTRFGRYWRACADDPFAARLMGIDFRSVLVKSLVLATALAGVAGTMSTLFYGGLGYAGGIVFGLKALIAAIVGGIGSIPGAFVGGILIGGLEALWSALFPIEYRDLAVYCALAAFLIWRPEGVLGAPGPGSR
jgi:branched-chain amino acid transport system permease protein